MNANRLKVVVFAALCIALVGRASVSHAGSWSIPAGQADHFSYSNGGDLNGLFGDPVISGDSFFFPGIDFVATAADGSTDLQMDTVSFDVVANPGLRFGLMRVTLWGDYAVSGDPLFQSADVDALLTWDENVPPQRHWEGPAFTTPTMPVHGGAGEWSGLAVIDPSFLGQEVSSLHVEFGVEMMVVSAPGGTSEIRLLTPPEGFDLTFTLIPEPTSFSFFGVGILVVGRRLRRCQHHGESRARVQSSR